MKCACVSTAHSHLTVKVYINLFTYSIHESESSTSNFMSIIVYCMVCMLNYNSHMVSWLDRTLRNSYLRIWLNILKRVLDLRARYVAEEVKQGLKFYLIN